MATKCSSTKALCVSTFICLLFSGVCGVHGDHEVHWVTKSQTQLNDSLSFNTLYYALSFTLFFFARILERSDFKVSIKNGNIAIGNIAAHLFWVSLFACWTPLLFSH